MDPSIRLKRIQDAFGNSPVKISELTPKQAATVALEVFAASQGHLSHLGGFQSFAEYAFDTRADDNECAKRERDDESKTYSLPGEYDGSSLCVPICIVSCIRWGMARTRRVRKQGFVLRQELLLTKEGDILVWDWFARCERPQGKGMREIAIRSKVRLVKGRSLKKFLSSYVNALALVTRIGWLVTDTIEDRRKRLASMEDLDVFIKAAEGHLQPG